MALRFITIEVESDAGRLADAAVERLQAQWPDWEPNDGDLEVVLIEALAPMAQNAAEVAAAVPSAVFRAFGTQLMGAPYLEGAPAVGEVTFTVIDTAGHTIPAGTEIAVDGWAFQTDEDAVVPPASSSVAGVAVTCNEYTESANDLPGDEVVLVSAVAFVSDVTLDATTADGVDPEDDQAYMDRLVKLMELQAVTLVTERDFELMALTDVRVGRAIAQNDGDRAVAVTLIGPDGLAVSAGCKSDLADLYEAYRQVNTVVTISDATYTAVSVTYAVKVYPDYDPATVISNIDGMLELLLSPEQWGLVKGYATPRWVNDDRVRKNLLIDRIGDVDGVHYVDSLSITGADGSGNKVLTGTVPLPTPGTMSGSYV